MHYKERDAGIESPRSGSDCREGETVRGEGVFIREGGGEVEGSIRKNLIILVTIYFKFE